MRLLTLLGLLVGLALTGYLISRHNLGALWASFAALGWGFLLLPLVYLPNIGVDSQCLRMVFPPDRKPRYRRAVWGTFVARAVNTLLPVASVGGEVVKARILVQGGTPGVLVGAGVVVDKTVQTVSLGLWGLIGLGSLVLLEASGGIVQGAAVATFGLGAGAAGFILVQRAGALGSLSRGLQSMLGRRLGERMAGLVDIASRSDEALKDSYRRPWRFVAAILLMTAARTFLAVEVWLVANLIGLPLDFLEALMLKSLTGAIRGAIFVVPSGIGIQESGFVLLGAMFGWPAEAMLAISLATRGREIAFGVAGLVGWQLAEGHTIDRRLRRSSTAEE